MPDHTTPHLALPLPHPGNQLDVDCLRLRAALTTLDERIAALQTVLATDDAALASAQAIIEAVRAAQADIDSLSTLIVTQVDALTADFRAELERLRPLIYAGL